MLKNQYKLRKSDNEHNKVTQSRRQLEASSRLEIELVPYNTSSTRLVLRDNSG
jgi:hypothetical protein